MTIARCTVNCSHGFGILEGADRKELDADARGRMMNQYVTSELAPVFHQSDRVSFEFLLRLLGGAGTGKQSIHSAYSMVGPTKEL